MEEAPAELADEALKMALVDPKDAYIIRIVRMLPAGFAATAKEPYPQLESRCSILTRISDWRTARHPDQHSDRALSFLGYAGCSGVLTEAPASPVRDPRRAAC